MKLFDQAYLEAVYLVQSGQELVNPQLVDQASELSSTFGDDCDPATGDGPVFWSDELNEYVFQYELDEYRCAFQQYEITQSCHAPVSLDNFPF